jgi:hypothetical protein
MAIERIKTIDLSKFDSNWADSYIKVATRGWNDQMRIQKELSAQQRELESLDNKRAKLAALDSTPENDDALAKVNLALEGISQSIIEFVAKLIEGRFREGKIMDNGVLRDIKAEELRDLDQEVINEIGQAIAGTSPKV